MSRRGHHGLVPVLLAAGMALAAPTAGHGQSCAVLEEGTCPQVYRIHGPAESEFPVNLLIVGDGFGEDDLEAFRCAAHGVAKKLLATPPFSDYACHLNIYRMDLVRDAADKGIQAAPECGCCVTQPPSYGEWKCADSTLGDPMFGEAASCGITNLGTTVCANKSSCYYSEPDAEGLDTLAGLADCIESPHTVLILLNTGLYTGAARAQNDPRFAVASIYDAAESSPWQMATHELAHALLDLHDEYGGSGCSGVAFRTNRNVARGGDLAAGIPSPWEAACDPCQTSCESDECNELVCDNGQPCCAETEPTPGMTATPSAYEIGLWEGAFCQDCGYYRSQESCQMRSLGKPFCAGCAQGTANYFEEMDLKACSP